MKFTTTGRITQISNTVTISGTYKKKEILVAEHDISNSNYAIFELIGSDIAKADGLKINDNVSITFIIQGRRYVTKQGKPKYFNNLIIVDITPGEKPDLTVNMPVTSFDPII